MNGPLHIYMFTVQNEILKERELQHSMLTSCVELHLVRIIISLTIEIC